MQRIKKSGIFFMAMVLMLLLSNPITLKANDVNNDEPKASSDEGSSNGSSGGGSGSTGSIPRVIVTGFATDPGTVKAGENFKLIIHVKNTSNKRAVSNLLFDLQAPSSGTEAAAEAPAFLPISGSSSIYLEQINAGGTKDISIDMNARADLVQKPYSIDVSMKYEDKEGSQFESTSSVAVPVNQPPRFEFSKLELSPESITVGEDTNLACNLYNTGRIKLYNVKVNVTGNGIEDTEAFIGNVEPGGTGAIDAMITGKKETTEADKCKMVISYEDEAGTPSTVEQEFNLEVTPEIQDMEEATVEEVKTGLPVVPIALGVAAILLVGIIVFVVIRRKKKKKEEEEEWIDELD